MSHIPASAMPHATPHHHEDEASSGSTTAEVKPADAFATSSSEANARTPVGPATVEQPDKPASSGWATVALALGGAALVAGAAALVLLREEETPAKPKGKEKPKSKA